MKAMTMRCRKFTTAFAAGLALLTSVWQALPSVPPSESPTPNLDRRTVLSSGAQIAPARQRAADDLQARLPGVRIDYDQVTGAPSWISSNLGLLSGPASEDEVTPRTAQAPPGRLNSDPYWPIKHFLSQNATLFGHGPEVLTNNARIEQEFVTAHNGMRSVSWEQELDSIPVFEATIIGHVTRRGELVNISSRFLPDIVNASGLSLSNRLNLESAAPVTARRAVVNALAHLGKTHPRSAQYNCPRKKQILISNTASTAFHFCRPFHTRHSTILPCRIDHRPFVNLSTLSSQLLSVPDSRQLPASSPLLVP